MTKQFPADGNEELKPLSKKHQMFVDQYFLCHFNGTEAYMRVYKPNSRAAAAVNASELLRNTNISSEIGARMSVLHMSADEALALQTEIANADMGVFHKVIDEWMFFPPPSSEILAEQEVIDDTDPEKPIKRISYRVRRVVLDMDKVIDPRYSHLIHEFSDSRRSGLKIKTYDKQAAIRDVLKVHGKFTEKVDLTNSDGSLKPETMKPSEIAERVAALLKAKDVNSS